MPGICLVKSILVPSCECGLTYSDKWPPDVRRHRREHDEYLHGVPGKPLSDDEVLDPNPECRIIVVRPNSSRRQHDRVERVASRANSEMRYDFGIYHTCEREAHHQFGMHPLLAWRDNRAIGFLLLERRSHVGEWRWADECPEGIPLIETSARWTIGFVWVLRKFRRQGVARRMLSNASRFCGTQIADLCWYWPLSDDGEALAKSVCIGGRIWVAK